MKLLPVLTALAVAGGAALSQSFSAAAPFINYRGVVNAASFEGQGLPGGSLAQGSIFTIFGSNLGPAQSVQSSSYPLQTQLGGVSISVTQGSNTLAAIPIFVTASQVSAIMPSTAAVGQAIVTLSYNNQTSNPAIVNVVAASPGIFSILSSGFGPGIVQNFVSQTNQPINTTQVTAQPGQTVILWGTGLGAVPYGDNVAPTPANLPTKVDVFVGNQPVTNLRYSGRSPCCAGLDQIVFDVPQNAPTGCYVPVQVRVNGAIVSNAVTIAIDKAGAACSDSFNPAGSAVRSGGNNGFISAIRSDTLDDTGADAPGDVTQDVLIADLRQDAGGATYFAPEYALPPVGACTMYSGKAFDNVASTMLFAPQSHPLDGGSALQVAAGGAPVEVGPAPGDSQLYGALLGEQPAVTGIPGLFFAFPGAFTVTISGGNDVKQAQVAGATPAPMQWTNRATLPTLNRAQGLTVTWTGGNPATDVALIGIQANNDAANSGALALCVAPVAAGTFSIPPEILASLPATPASAVRVPAWVMVASEPLLSPASFSATGLQGGFLLPSYAAAKSVVVQ